MITTIIITILFLYVISALNKKDKPKENDCQIQTKPNIEKETWKNQTGEKKAKELPVNFYDIDEDNMGIIGELRKIGIKEAEERKHKNELIKENIKIETRRRVKMAFNYNFSERE